MKTQMVKADLYQLTERTNDIYRLDGAKRKLKDGALVQRKYVDKINGAYQTGGKWYEVDEVATKEYYALREEQIEQNDQNILKNKQGLNDLASALIQEGAKKSNENDRDSSEREELTARYIELFDKAPGGRMKPSTMKEKIEAKEAELED